MLSKKLVLPNFLKVLTIAAFALGSANAVAGDQAAAEKKADDKIVELKEMTSDSKLTAEEEAAVDAKAEKAKSTAAAEKKMEKATSSLTSDE